jgi:hypothetical protein
MNRVEKAAEAIVVHVLNGGWISASWPIRVEGILDLMDNSEGFLSRAYNRAEEIAAENGWNLSTQSHYNFHDQDDPLEE